MKEKIITFFADKNKRKNFIFICSISVALILIIIIPLFLPKDEGEKQQYKTYSFSIFDTMTTIVGYEIEGEEFGETSKKVLELLDEYHRLFDIYNDYYECSKCNIISACKNDEDNDKRICKECKKPLSDNEIIANISTVNKLVEGEHPVVKVDRKIIDMLLYAKEMHTLTGGKMNVAMGSVLSIWHDYRTAGLDQPVDAELPPMDALLAAAEHTDIDKVIINEENSTVWLSDPEMKLDVGAFAKGYAVEMAARALEEMGKTGYVVNIGGNIRTVGARADGKKWKTGVENPAGDGYIEYIGLETEAIVTSGSYQRYYVVGGKRYHHIIDPDTLMPSEGLLSVSIICADSGMGDGLSTALFCMSIEDGMALINSLEGVEAIWVDENEVKHYSNNFKDYLYEE